MGLIIVVYEILGKVSLSIWSWLKGSLKAFVYLGQLSKMLATRGLEEKLVGATHKMWRKTRHAVLVPLCTITWPSRSSTLPSNPCPTHPVTSQEPVSLVEVAGLKPGMMLN